MMDTDPNLESLVVDKEGRRESKVQSAAIFEEHKTPKQNTKEQQFDSPLSSQDSQSSREKSSIFSLKLAAQGTQFWQIMKDIKKTNNFQEFWRLNLDLDLAMCILIVFRRTIPQNSDHIKVIATSISLFQSSGQTIPYELARFYENFFDCLTPDKFKQLKLEHLKPLFIFCREINADVNWLKELEEPFILFDFASVKGAAEAVHLLLKFKSRYSLKYFAFIDQVIHNSVYASMVKDFTCLLSFSALIFDISWKKALCQFSNIINREREHNDVKGMAIALLDDNKNEIKFSKLMMGLEVVLENNNINDTKLFLSQHFNSKDELSGIIQNSMKAAAKHAERQTEFAKQEQIKKDLEDKQKVEEEKKKKAEKEARVQKKQKEREQYQQDLINTEDQFKKANMTDQSQFKSKELGQLFEGNLQSLHKTVEVILNKQQLKLKPNQVVVLNLLLKCKSRVIFIQLGTGFGKSRAIIAPLADAVRWATGAKSVVVVPTKILRAIHHEYCIDAKYAPELLIDTDQIDTIYCTYDTFLQNQHLIPTSANIFVDESHLFLKENARIIENKAILPSEILKRFTRVYMLSATFGGQQGIAELQKLFKGSFFIHSPRELAQKDLSQVQVIGNLACRDAILEKAVEVAKLQAQGMPVILFCKDDKECLKLNAFLQDASIFGGGSDTAQLLDIIRICKEISKDKVILTTQKACIGIDFIFKVLRAFVILTEDATYLEELLQPLGRSSRVNNKLPLLGCILTQGGYNDIQSLEKSLKDKSADLKIFSKQIRDNIGMLGVCPSAKTQNQLQKLGDAINSLNSIPNQNVKAGLQSITDFKKAIEQYFRQVNKTTLTSTVGGENNSSLVSIAQLLDQNELINQGILKKRNLQERESSNASGFSSSNEAQFFKRQKQKEQVNSEEVQMQDSSEEEQEVSAFQGGMFDEGFVPGVRENRMTQSHESLQQQRNEEEKQDAPVQEEKDLLKKLAEKHNIALVPMFQEKRDDDQITERSKEALSFQVSEKAQSAYKKRQKVGSYPCKSCDKIFETAEKRRKHKYVVHTDKGKQRQKDAKEKYKKK